MKTLLRAGALALVLAILCVPQAVAAQTSIKAPAGYAAVYSGPPTTPATTLSLTSSVSKPAPYGEAFLLSFTATATVPGYFFVIDGSAAPADGAITGWLECIPYPTAGQPLGYSATGAPVKAAAGITVVFSTTGCFTLTKSASAAISLKALP